MRGVEPSRGQADGSTSASRSFDPILQDNRPLSAMKASTKGTSHSRTSLLDRKVVPSAREDAIEHHIGSVPNSMNRAPAFQTYRSFVRTESEESTKSMDSARSSVSTSTITTAQTTPSTSFHFGTSIFDTDDFSKSLDIGSSKRHYRLWPALPEDQQQLPVLPRCPFQQQLDASGVRFSVQWELERLLACQSDVGWDDIRLDDLVMLEGAPSHMVPNLGSFIAHLTARRSGSQSAASWRRAWTVGPTNTRRARMLLEMDQEEVNTQANDYGITGKRDEARVYGGKVSYAIVVRPAIRFEGQCVSTAHNTNSVGTRQDPRANSDRHQTNSFWFKMSLCPPDVTGKSFRLARRFGSRRVITFRLKDFRSHQKADVIGLFVGRRFLLFGRTYRALWAPPDRDSVFAIEVFDGSCAVHHDIPIPSFQDVLNSEPILLRDARSNVSV